MERETLEQLKEASRQLGRYETLVEVGQILDKIRSDNTIDRDKALDYFTSELIKLR